MIVSLLSVIGRPNTLDAEVTAIPAARLLHASPASLIDPARAAAALHLQQFRTPVWIVMIALEIGVLAWFWNTGRSAGLRDRLRAAIPSEFAMRFCFGALLAGLARLAALIPQAVEYRYMRILDLNELLFRSWLVEWFASTLIAMAVAGAIASIVLWLADRTHQWYLYTIAGVMGCTLLVSYGNPVAIAPAYTHFTPLPASGSPLQPAIARLERKTGVQAPIVEAHVAPRSKLGASYVMGWGGSQRIVITDTLRAAATPGELQFVIARGMAWVEANTGLHIALVEGAFLVIGTALAVFIADRIGFRRDDDPVSRLALLGALMGCVYVIAVPFYNGFLRSADRTTDAAAIALTRDQASAIRLELRHADQGLVPLCPNPFAYWYFDAHVPPGTRISDLQGAADYCRATRHP